MRETIAHKIGVQRLPQSIFPDDLLQREKDHSSLSVGNLAIRAIVVEEPCKPRKRIKIGPAEVREALAIVFAQLSKWKIAHGRRFAVESVHYFGFCIAVDALIKP